MPSPKTQTTAVTNVQDADTRRRGLLEVYKNEPKVERSISPLYESYLGKVIQISLNGITIAFPVNGSVHSVPQSFADEIDSRVMAVNATIQKAKKMSQVSENTESYPGELQMF